MKNKKELIRPLPKFYSNNIVSKKSYLASIIADLQRPKSIYSPFPYSDKCPCADCHDCNAFFTHMENSSRCPCTAIQYGEVSCDDVILRLKEAIKRIEE